MCTTSFTLIYLKTNIAIHGDVSSYQYGDLQPVTQTVHHKYTAGVVEYTTFARHDNNRAK